MHLNKHTAEESKSNTSAQVSGITHAIFYFPLAYTEVQSGSQSSSCSLLCSTPSSTPTHSMLLAAVALVALACGSAGHDHYFKDHPEWNAIWPQSPAAQTNVRLAALPSLSGLWTGSPLGGADHRYWFTLSGGGFGTNKVGICEICFWVEGHLSTWKDRQSYLHSPGQMIYIYTG